MAERSGTIAGVRRGLEQLRWGVLAIAALVGIAVVAAAWWAGPGIFGAGSAVEERVVEATVTMPVPCSTEQPQETVHFDVDGSSGNGMLNACGHDQDERLEIAVPHQASGSGLPEVHTADTLKGHSDLRRPVGLVLIAFSCVGGGVYVFLVVRGPRRRAALA